VNGKRLAFVKKKLVCDKITPDMVYKKLNKLKMKKAPSVDFVGTKMLVELSEVISEVVAILFNKSIINYCGNTKRNQMIGSLQL